MTHNEWFTTNLKLRSKHPDLDFKMNIDLYNFKNMRFHDASDYTCDLISDRYSNLHLALSGGLDSEYVLRAFHRNNIPITPVIIECANRDESKYAHMLCEQLNVTPIVIEKTETEFFKCFFKNILYKFNSIGYNSTQLLLAAEYVKSVNGVLINGNHFMGDGDDLITDEKYVISNEWDFYANEYSEQLVNIDFFFYTAELTYSMMPRTYGTWNDHKQNLYEIEYRDKLRPKYSKNLNRAIETSISTLYIPKRTGEVWSKRQFFEKFNKVRK